MLRFTLFELFAWTTFLAICCGLAASLIPPDDVGPMAILISIGTWLAWTTSTVIVWKAAGPAWSYWYSMVFAFCLFVILFGIWPMNPRMPLLADLLLAAAMAAQAGAFVWVFVSLPAAAINAIANRRSSRTLTSPTAPMPTRSVGTQDYTAAPR